MSLNSIDSSNIFYPLWCDFEPLSLDEQVLLLAGLNDIFEIAITKITAITAVFINRRERIKLGNEIKNKNNNNKSIDNNNNNNISN